MSKISALGIGTTFYFLKDTDYWSFEVGSRTLKGPWNIPQYWYGLEGNLDAALGIDTRYYLFKGDKYRRLHNQKLSGPASITKYWGQQIQTPLDAAIGIDTRYYLFKGNQYWKLEGEDPANTTGPHTIQDEWPDLPGNLDAAVGVDNKLWFFKFGENHFWRLNLDRNKFTGPIEITEKFDGLTLT